MSPLTRTMLLEVVRHLKGALTVIEQWLKGIAENDLEEHEKKR